MVVHCFCNSQRPSRSIFEQRKSSFAMQNSKQKCEKNGLFKGVFPDGHEDYMSLPIVSEATTHLHDLSRLCKCISRLHPIFVECFCDSQRPSRSALKQGKSTFDMQISRQKM